MATKAKPPAAEEAKAEPAEIEKPAKPKAKRATKAKPPAAEEAKAEPAEIEKPAKPKAKRAAKAETKPVEIEKEKTDATTETGKIPQEP